MFRFIEEVVCDLEAGIDVQEVCLCRQRITDADIESLVKNLLAINSTVKYINSNHTNLSDKAAEFIAHFLKHNSTLTQLDLSFNKIGNKGFNSIAKSLEVNSTVTHLYLSNNLIDDGGVDFIKKALKKNSTVVYIDLYNNNISHDNTINTVMSKSPSSYASDLPETTVKLLTGDIFYSTEDV